LTVDNKYGFSPPKPTDEQALYGTRPSNSGVYGQSKNLKLRFKINFLTFIDKFQIYRQELIELQSHRYQTARQVHRCHRETLLP
jgi:hypothetical protein